MLVNPENPITDTIITITTKDNQIFVKFPERNDKFRSTIKELSFTWNEYYFCWYREIENVTDRIAQTGRELLEAGFIVDFPDNTSLQMAMDKSYNNEPYGRIAKAKDDGDFSGYFIVKWRYGHSLYDNAIRIKGARYCKPYVCIPKQRYKEVLDFAEYHHYEISTKAMEMIASAKQEFEQAITFKSSEAVKPTNNFEVLDELKD